MYSERGSIIQISEGSVEWKVDNYYSLNVNESYSSPLFSFAETEWTLWISRDYFEEPERERIVLWLDRYMGPHSIMDVEYTLSVKDQDGETCAEQRNRKEFEACQASPLILIFSCYRDFDYDYREMSKLLPNDTLTVCCDLKCFDPIQGAALLKEQLEAKAAELDAVKRELGDKQSELVRLQCLNEELNLKMIDLEASRENVKMLYETEPFEKMSHDFKELMLNGDYSDVIIQVQGEEFRLHRTILSARSPYFHSMFKCNMKEKSTGVVEIDDCEPDVFQSFIHFLYTGKAEELSPENVHRLYEVADKYQEGLLKNKCLQFMMNSISEASFCDFIVIALKYDEKELLQESVRLFTSKGREIARSVKWQNFLREYPTEANELFIKTLDLFMK